MPVRKYFRSVTAEFVADQSGLPDHLAADEIQSHIGAGFRSPIPWLFPAAAVGVYFVATTYIGIGHFWVRGGSGAELMLGLACFASGGMFAAARSIACDRIIASAKARQHRLAGKT